MPHSMERKEDNPAEAETVDIGNNIKEDRTQGTGGTREVVEPVLNMATQCRATRYLLNTPQITGKISYRQYPRTLYNL